MIYLLAQAVAPAESAGEGVMGNNLLETFLRGGEIMWVILGASVIGLMFIFEALWKTRGAALLPGKLAERLHQPLATSELQELARPAGVSAVERVLAAGWRWRGGSHEQIQAAIEEAVDEALWRFKRAVRPIGIVANVAPLLGLLGTVFGIIRAFDVVARQGALGDPGALAGGISEALLTTAFGMCVAIPMLLAYHFFNGRIESALRRCEELAKEQLIQPPDSPTPPDTSAPPENAPATTEPR